jgi:hypothetical protein
LALSALGTVSATRFELPCPLCDHVARTYTGHPHNAKLQLHCHLRNRHRLGIRDAAIQAAEVFESGLVSQSGAVP